MVHPRNIGNSLAFVTPTLPQKRISGLNCCNIDGLYMSACDAITPAVSFFGPRESGDSGAAVSGRRHSGRHEVIGEKRCAIAAWIPYSGRHTHPGLETSYVLDGEVTLTIDGQPPKVYKAGDAFQLVYRQLGLRYRVIELCCGQLPFSAAKAYKPEVFLPISGYRSPKTFWLDAAISALRKRGDAPMSIRSTLPRSPAAVSLMHSSSMGLRRVSECWN
jgi:uncharacterized cupin superfamily protein